MVVLNGEFKVIREKKKYKIFYLENAVLTPCSMADFDTQDDANEYIINHRAQLEKYVAEVKEAALKKEEEAIKKETAKTVKKVQKAEAKKKKKEEKEQQKQLRKEDRKKKRQAKKEEREKNKAQRVANAKRFGAGFLAAVITLVGGHYAAVGIKSAVEGNKKPSTSQEDPTYSPEIDDIIEEDEGLNIENFATLTATFSKQYVDNNVNVSTEDLTKFVSIVNIDMLVEENQEFAKELFGTQTKEEYLGDAAKVIGMTYTYNRNVFEREGSTENFIRISESVYGPQKQVLQTVEGYVDQIALVKDNAEEANKLITELIVRLGDPQSDLSYMDDGVASFY